MNLPNYHVKWFEGVILKKKFYNKNQFLKKIFQTNLFKNYTIDSERKYIVIFKKISYKEKIFNIKFKKILWKYKIHKNLLVAFGENLPSIIPDFIYVDGPNPNKVINQSRKFSKIKDFPIIINDILLFENFLNKGCIIVIEGRAHNASYLLRELKRSWKYKYYKAIDTHVLKLKENVVGVLGRKLTNYYS